MRFRWDAGERGGGLPVDGRRSWLPGVGDAAAFLTQGASIVGELDLECQLFSRVAATCASRRMRSGSPGGGVAPPAVFERRKDALPDGRADRATPGRADRAALEGRRLGRSGRLVFAEPASGDVLRRGPLVHRYRRVLKTAKIDRPAPRPAPHVRDGDGRCWCADADPSRVHGPPQHT